MAKDDVPTVQNTDPVTPLGRGYRANATQKEHRAREDAMLRFHRNGTSNHSYVIFWETKDPSDTTSESTEGGTTSLGLLSYQKPLGPAGTGTRGTGANGR
jgi:hypothetical protein